MKNKIDPEILNQFTEAVFPGDLSNKHFTRNLMHITYFTLYTNIECMVLANDSPEKLIRTFEEFLMAIGEQSYALLKERGCKLKDKEFIEQLKEIIKNKSGIKPDKVH